MTFAFPKPHSVRSDRYLAWIRRQACIVCKGAPEAAHIGPHGLRIKTDDFRALPICHRHHVSGNDSLHQQGTVKFEELFSLDLKEQVIRFMIRFLFEELTIGE